MRKLKIVRILEYYDVPQLFIAEDAINTRYLCLLYDINDEGELLCIGVLVSPTKLNDFIKGHSDLRSLFEQPEMDGAIYSIKVCEDEIVANVYTSQLEDSMLPDEGYFYDDNIKEDDDMIECAQRNHRPIIRLAFQTPDNRHDIDARTLSAALLQFQSLVGNSYRKLYRNDTDLNSNLRVTTFMAASFDVEFIADEDLDLFGSSKISNTLDVINKSFSDSSADVIETLRMIKGYAVNSYRKFIDVLLENNLEVDLKWVSSIVEREVHHNSIDRNRLQLLYEIVNNNIDLGTEIRTFEGFFIAANVESGLWNFQPIEGKLIKGKSVTPNNLVGVTLQERIYRIVCDVQLSQNDTTLKEKIDYILMGIEEVGNGN